MLIFCVENGNLQKIHKFILLIFLVANYEEKTKKSTFSSFFLKGIAFLKVMRYNSVIKVVKSGAIVEKSGKGREK